MGIYRRLLLSAAAAAAFAGCFTVSETEMPKVPIGFISEAASTNRTVVIRGFEATLTEYVPVHGYSTVYVPGHHGHRHWHPGHYETVASTTYVPQTQTTQQFYQQAVDRMEAAGFNLGANPADYVVEVVFTGPFSGEKDPGAWRALLWLCTAFTFDHDADTWNARLKIHDNRTGRLVFTRDYSQEYSVTCFSPIPLFGPASYERTGSNYMQSWCLTALTDRCTSEAAAFIAARP